MTLLPDPPHWAKESPVARVTKIAAASFFAMIALAWMTAVCSVIGSSLYDAHDLAGFLLLATIVGSVMGLMHAPYFCAALWRADLRRALPVVYGITVLPTLVGAVIFGPGSILFAFVFLFPLSSLAGLQFRVFDQSVCEKCGYSLRGLADPGCPECGWGRSTAAPQ